MLKPGYVIEVKPKGFDKTKRLAFTLEQEPVCQAALVAIDPWEGKVKAMVGGVDFQRSEYNHATMAHRQPGSAFKPLVYAVAMENGFTPASIINDEPRSYDNDTWKPANYDREYYGPTRLRDALVYSRNVVTIELLHEVGVQKVIDLATKLGMTGPFARNLTLALGSGSVTPLELTTAYCSFANGGYDINPVTILRVIRQKRPCAGGTRIDARSGPVLRDDLSGYQYASRCSAARDGHAGFVARQAGGREDRDDQRLQGCMVRRIHPQPRSRGMGGP